jgi:DNA repair photolyase
MEVQAINRRMPVHFGGLSDCFQPLEKEDRATLSILQILSNYNYPTLLSTKGDILLEDRYIKQFENIPIVLQITISSLNESVAKVMEPNAPTPKRRLEVVKQLSDMGFYVTVRNEPSFPFFEDENREDFFREIANAGAKHVSTAPVRMYSTRQDAFKRAFGNEWVQNYLEKSVGYLGYKRLKNEYIIDYSKKNKEYAHKYGLTYGGASDVDSLESDSFCCCYPVEKFKEHKNISKYNFYHAARLCKEKGTVTFDDISKEWHPNGKMYEKSAQSYTKTLPQWQSVESYFSHQWDMKKSSGMVMSDINGIYHEGFDENNHPIFKYGENNGTK